MDGLAQSNNIHMSQVFKGGPGSAVGIGAILRDNNGYQS